MMKALIFILAALLATGCTKNFEEINTNPNAPEAAPATNLLLSGISTGFHEAFTGFDGEFGGISFRPAGFWCQYLAEFQQVYEADKYNFSPTTMELQWRQMYEGPLQDLRVIIDNPENGPNIRAAAMVIKAWLISILTGLYGDIPYFQANQVSEQAQPPYDSQESIYKGLTTQLSLAAELFSADGGELGPGDILYSGNWANWKKFANSLRARLLNRYKHLDAAAEQELRNLLGNPAALIAGKQENATLIPVGVYPYTHPFYQANQFWMDYFRPSATFVNLLKDNKDPRLSIYFRPGESNSSYVGIENGVNQPPPLADLSAFGPLFLDNPRLPMHAMTYAEALFIRAEVFQDKQAYLDGMAAAMELVGAAPTPESAAEAEAAWASNYLEAIATQKWIALFPDTNEAFAEYRRTGFPASIREALNSRFPGMGIPHRYAYPPIEESTNGDNLAAARQRQNIQAGLEIFGDPMWWARN